MLTGACGDCMNYVPADDVVSELTEEQIQVKRLTLGV